MKQTLLFIGIAAVLSVAVLGISNSSKMKKVDATELAQFQAWKAMEKQVPVMAMSNPVATKKVASHKSRSMSSSETNNAKVAKKKGWSKAAKYSAIGGGSGVILGAVINKRNRAAGGAIGGLFGAGLGYLFGRSQDKKDGRY